MQNIEQGVFKERSLELKEERRGLITKIEHLQKKEFDAMKLKLINRKDPSDPVPSHIREFLLVRPTQLTDRDLEIFKKFQEFMRYKDDIKTLEELDKITDYFKECESAVYSKDKRKVEALKALKEGRKTQSEVDKIFAAIDGEREVLKDSSSLIHYITNVINGYNEKLIAKLGYE